MLALQEETMQRGSEWLPAEVFCNLFVVCAGGVFNYEDTKNCPTFQVFTALFVSDS
jgi:hypothetical protein